MMIQRFLIQNDLAETLKRIADYGIDGFYSGKTAELIVSEMNDNNGLISLEDLKNYDSVYRKPLTGTYRDKKIVSMGPPSSGGALLIQMLNMLENYNIENMSRNSVEFVHLMTEVQRLAYADRAIHIKHVASGYRFQAKTGLEVYISKLKDKGANRFSKAFLETTAIIAYKQPVTRGDIEDIRGISVNSNIIRTLLELEWIKVVGHKETPGKPELFATTSKFLDYFDKNTLSDLPEISDVDSL